MPSDQVNKYVMIFIKSNIKYVTTFNLDLVELMRKIKSRINIPENNLMRFNVCEKFLPFITSMQSKRICTDSFRIDD
jgi:hypothetical protein